MLRKCSARALSKWEQLFVTVCLINPRQQNKCCNYPQNWGAPQPISEHLVRCAGSRGSGSLSHHYHHEGKLFIFLSSAIPLFTWRFHKKENFYNPFSKIWIWPDYYFSKLFQIRLWETFPWQKEFAGYWWWGGQTSSIWNCLKQTLSTVIL